jgi:hypothetical protein
MMKINKENYLVYPSVFEIDYDSKSTFNTNTINNQFYRDIGKTKIFHLESLNICNLKEWNECFKITNIHYNKKIYKSIEEYLRSDEFHDSEKKEDILKTGKIAVDYTKFGEICCDIQKVFSGTFNYVGESFSKSQLVVGSLQNYIFQYISNCVFGIPNVYIAINNLPEINQLVESLPKKLISNLTNNGVLQSLYNDFVKEICTEKKEEKRCSLFRKKNVIEFSIFLKSPELNFKSSNALKDELMDEIINIDVPDSLWKVYFILN